MSYPSDEKLDKESISGQHIEVAHAYDSEKHTTQGELNAFGQKNGEELQRALKARHVAMISIGGVIGTGLFLGSGKVLAASGPLALWLGYITMGTVCAAVMFSLGEVASYLPVPGGHIKLAERFVEPAFSAALGYNYWINWLLIYPAELTAAAGLMGYWAPNVNPAVWVATFMVPTVGINMLGARGYGEAEFWFASIKVLTIIGLIILSFFIDVGAVGGKALGFWYWNTPFKQFNDIPGAWGRFVAFWGVLIQAAFSFIGAEITAMAAGESANPRRNIPRAIKTVYARILIFYVLGTLAISVVCDSNDPRLTGSKGVLASPFVIAISNANINVLPHIINACLITSATSAGSSDLYTSSRALYSLSIVGNAPRVFARTTKSGLPYVSLAVSCVVGLLAFTVTSAGAYRIFNLLVNLTANAGLISWACIAWTAVRFHAGTKAQGLDRSTFPYRAPLSSRIPFPAYWALFWALTCIFFSGFTFLLTGGWDAPGFVTNYLPAWLFPIIYLIFKFTRGSKVVAVEDMDFTTGLREIIDAEEPELPPKNFVEKLWRKLS